MNESMIKRLEEIRKNLLNKAGWQLFSDAGFLLTVIDRLKEEKESADKYVAEMIKDVHRTTQANIFLQAEVNGLKEKNQKVMDVYENIIGEAVSENKAKVEELEEENKNKDKDNLVRVSVKLQRIAENLEAEAQRKVTNLEAENKKRRDEGSKILWHGVDKTQKLVVEVSRLEAKVEELEAENKELKEQIRGKE